MTNLKMRARGLRVKHFIMFDNDVYTVVNSHRSKRSSLHDRSCAYTSTTRIPPFRRSEPVFPVNGRSRPDGFRDCSRELVDFSLDKPIFVENKSATCIFK